MTTTKLNQFLGVALVGQLLLVGFAWMPRASETSESRDLVPTDAASLDKITIYGRTARDEVPEAPTVLVRDGTTWKIASTFDYPADPELLEPLFEAIDSLVARTPVATQAYSHAALDVADEQHMNKFEIVSGENTTTLFLGAAEGKAAHVRLDGEDDVYKVRGFSVAGLPYRANRIFDRDFLKIPVVDVTSLSIERPGQPPVRLAVTESDGWTMEGLPEGRVLDQPKTRDFVRTSTNLRMLEPHGTEVTADMGFDQGIVVSFTTDDDGTTTSHQYVVGNEIPGENGRLFLKTSDHPWVFELLKGNLQHALDPKTERIISQAIDVDGLLEE